MRRPRIVIVTNLPSPYFVERFDLLASRDRFEYDAWFTAVDENGSPIQQYSAANPSRSWIANPESWWFAHRFVDPRTMSVGEFRRLLQLQRPDLVVTQYDQPVYLRALAAARSLEIRVALQVMITYASWFPRRKHKELAKHILFRSVDGIEVSGPESAGYARRYGGSAERIVKVQQTIPYDLFAPADGSNDANSSALKESLRLPGHLFLYSGRLWQGKGLDDLFDAYEILQRERPGQSSLLLVGDGPDEARYRQRAASLPNVAFAGFVQRDEIAAYYAIADSLVFPTLGDPYGYVVEEAMAARLPVISSSAAGEIRYRLPPDAGIVYEVGQTDHLRAAMTLFLDHPGLVKSMGMRGTVLASQRDHVTYATDFEQFVERIISLPRNSSASSRALSLIGATAGKFPSSHGATSE